MATRDTAGTHVAQRYGYLAARVLLAAIFVVTGWDKLANTQDAVADIAGAGLPAPFLLASWPASWS